MTTGGDMNAQEFVAAIAGQQMTYSRQCLATGRMADEERELTPSDPCYHDSGCNVVVQSIHWYSDSDCLFTQDFGVFVAVVKTGAGHLFCDRFVPLEVVAI